MSRGPLQKGFRYLGVFGHTDAAVHSDRLRKQRPGLLAVAGCVAFEEHPGVPAAGLRLLNDVGQLLGPPQCCPKMLLGLRPLPAAGGRDARERIEQAQIDSSDPVAGLFIASRTRG